MAKALSVCSQKGISHSRSSNLLFDHVLFETVNKLPGALNGFVSIPKRGCGVWGQRAKALVRG
jgi:hypothetical protein